MPLLDAPRCEEIAGQLSEFLDGDLDPPAAARVAVHLARCEGCARLEDELARLVRALHARPPGRDRVH